MDQIRLNIDGQEVKANPGMTVLEAALEAGIYIPTLCFDPDLELYGGCCLFIVEIKGTTNMYTTYTTPVADSVVIEISTPVYKVCSVRIEKINQPD